MITQSYGPIIPSWVNVFSKILSIGYLDLTACFWVVRSGNLVNDRVFVHKFLKNLIAKMLPPH